MTIEENKQLYRRFIQEVFNEGKVERAEAFLAPDYVLHDAPPDAPTGAAAVVGVVRMFRAAFPDLVITLDALVAEGDVVCARATTRGTHRGAFMGNPPTGNTVSMTGLTMVRVSGGRIAESWVKNDTAGLLRQLAK